MGSGLTLLIRICILLALLVRMGPGVADSMVRAVDPLAGAPICHSDTGGGAPADADHPAPHDCAVCPVCLTTLPAFLTGAPPDAPAVPVVARVADIVPPPSTGPPAPGNRSARPRGPPV